MKIRDYSAAIEAERVKANTSDNLDYTPLFVPTDCELPETSHQAIAKIMLSSGVISQDDYNKMIGVTYDGDFNTESETFDFEDWEDDFKQSAFARYEDNLEINHEQARLDTEFPIPSQVPDGDSLSSETRPVISDSDEPKSQQSGTTQESTGGDK